MNQDSSIPTDGAVSPAGTDAQLPVAALSYEAPPAESAVSARVIELFGQTRPWALFLAIMGFIGCGLMALGGVAMLMLVSVAIARQPAAALIAVGYLVFAVVAFFPAMALYRYARQIRVLGRLRREVDMEAAIDAQRAVWKLYGILTIIVISLYAVGILVGIYFTIRR